MHSTQLFLVTAAAFVSFMPASSDACSALRLIGKDQSVTVGRTMEFGFDFKSNIVVIPAGTKLTSSLDDPSTGMQYTAKHSIVGCNVLDMKVVIDGINDQGLYVGGLYFPGYNATAKLTKENGPKALATEDYGTWLLATFANVDEVKKHYKDAIIVEHSIELIGGASFPGHYLIQDRSGKSIVIEPTPQGMELHENPLGALTNSPGFEWHMTNLSNYMNVAPSTISTRKIGDLEINQLGGGSGFLGLPGDFTPPSRFLRLVAFSQSAPQPENAEDGIFKVSHIMNMFDIPFGAIQLDKGHVDYTLWTSISDLTNNVYHYKTFKNQGLIAVDLKKMVAAAKGEYKVVKMETQPEIKEIPLNFIAK